MLHRLELRKVGGSTPLELFSGDTWIFFLFIVSLVCSAREFAERIPLLETASCMIFNFIGMTSVHFVNRGRALLIISSMALLSNFNLGNLYTNEVTTRPVDRTLPIQIRGFYRCRFNSFCDYKGHPMTAMLASDGAL